ncbi:MAG: cytidylate kinase-like family protein [Desulfatibacillum sp.]|nr:cytidylate kinase-like family protein [Desulfatibacillum sp.]
MPEIVTIARQFGAGGHTLGAICADRLGYSLIDEEMVNAVADKAKVSPEWVQSVEKDRGDWLLNFFSKLVTPSFLDRLLDDENRGHINENIYVDHLREIMEELAREGKAVIVGRGGQYILQGHPRVLHVLLISDLEHRIKFLCEHYNMTEQKAELTVHRADKRRANFYKKLGKKNFDDPKLYHVVLNLSKIQLKQAEDIVCELAGYGC